MAESSLWNPPELWSTKLYFRSTRKGKILKNASECYLRDDLGLGYLLGRNNENKNVLIESTQHLLSLLVKQKEQKQQQLVICDANVLIHNLDILEHENCAISNIVIPQTSLSECKKTSLSAYNRVIHLLREADSKKRCVIFFSNEFHVETQPNHIDSQMKISENDKNDAKIRKVAEFFGLQLKGTHVRVVLLTDDYQSRVLANMNSKSNKEEGNDSGNNDRQQYIAESVRHHVKQLEQNDPSLALSDLVAQFLVALPPTKTNLSSVESTGSKKEQSSMSTNRLFFSPHLSTSQLLLGVKSGAYYQGVIRVKRSSSSNVNPYFNCYVTVRRGEERIAVSITDPSNVNRAVDGDVVAIQLHCIQEWVKANQLNTKSQKNDTNIKKNQKPMVGIAQETAEPSIRDEENVQDSLSIPSSSVISNDMNNTNEKTTNDNDEPIQYQPTGKIVGIVRRNFRQNYCGSIFDSSKASHTTMNETTQNHDVGNNHCTFTSKESIVEQYEAEHPDGTMTCVFFAVDARIPPILIRTTQKNRLLGKRILTAIDSWPADSPYPLGHYVKTIGNVGVKDVETEVLLHEHDIPCDPFPAKVLACLPLSDYKIDIQNSPGRLDLRHLPVLSIDPPGCKDIDDALHCIVLPNGNYQVGVHIADVTHYVKPNTEIDKEAANRSTSTYLVNKRLDMLPSLLTTDLCSLKGNVDRFAFSVLWEVTPDAQIINVDFRKSIIHSIAALTYQQAQALIDQPVNESKVFDSNSHNHDDASIQMAAVKRLALLARKFRKRRIDAGALTLASPEVKFVLDSESLNPTDVQSYALFEANALVEEFMLLANVTVGKKILRNYPTLCVLRRHPAPNRTMFTSLLSKAKCRGFHIDIEDSKRLADSLDAAVLPSDPYFNKLLRILSTRCMSPAQYFCSGEYKPSDWHHYGLAAPVYTHFTSPIRRYADVCVHRLLAASIGVDPLPVHLSSKSYLHDLTLNMNRRHRSAQFAGRASVQLHTLIFFSNIESEATKEDAYVLDVDTSKDSDCPSFTVIIPRYGIEGRVLLSHIQKDDNRLVREPDFHRIRYNCNDNDDHEQNVSIQVFDKVQVKIWVKPTAEDGKELSLDLIHPYFGKMDPKNEPDERKKHELENVGVEKSKKKKKRKQK